MSPTKSDEEQRPRVCRYCSAPLTILTERDRIVFFECDSCGTMGSFSPPAVPVQHKKSDAD